MDINKNQRLIIIIGMAIIVFMGLFPPWTYTFKVQSIYSEKPAGYSFIASPPAKNSNDQRQGIKIDMSRLLIQWVVVIAASGCGVLLATKRKDENSEQNS